MLFAQHAAADRKRLARMGKAGRLDDSFRCEDPALRIPQLPKLRLPESRKAESTR